MYIVGKNTSDQEPLFTTAIEKYYGMLPTTFQRADSYSSCELLLEGYWKTIVSCFLRTKPLLKYQTTGLT